MDFSQLPKMSNTPPVPPAKEEESSPVVAAAAPAAPRGDIAYAPGGFGFGGVWISLIGGLIFLMLGWNFARWLLGKLGGQELSTGWVQADGVTPVKYFELQGGTAWTETGLFLMGIALLLDAALMLAGSAGRTPHRAVVVAVVAVTGVAMLINLALVGHVARLGLMPLTSLIALLVGGMVLFDHLPMLKRR